MSLILNPYRHIKTINDNLMRSLLGDPGKLIVKGIPKVVITDVEKVYSKVHEKKTGVPFYFSRLPNPQVIGGTNIITVDGRQLCANYISFAASAKTTSGGSLVGNGTLQLFSPHSLILAAPAGAHTPNVNDKYAQFTSPGAAMDGSGGSENSMVNLWPLDISGITVSPDAPNPYPTVDDPDTDNTDRGDSVVSYKFFYSATDNDFSNGTLGQTIKNYCLVVWAGVLGTPPAGTAKLLTHGTFTVPWNKTTAQIAEVFYNVIVSSS